MTADWSDRWSEPGTVAGFSQSPPNASLMGLAGVERTRVAQRPLAIDLGCGAARNAAPLAASGWHVFGIDRSAPMADAARRRGDALPPPARLHVARAEMDALPARDALFDLVIAHGIWNLARSALEFRRAVREAARVSAAGAALFVFTFSRATLPAGVSPVHGEPFVFTEFSGEPQCFLTAAQLVSELADAGFEPDPEWPMRELNRQPPGVRAASVPVIWEAVFRRSTGS